MKTSLFDIAGINSNAVVMYIDMNSYFASCEQQQNPELRYKPVGIITYDSPRACVIAASQEAKDLGVKTGMRLDECKLLCPHIIPVTTHPSLYRQIHVKVIQVIKKYCDDVLVKSIDEAVANFTTYKLIYNDFFAVARQIKTDIAEEFDYLKCSIGIAPNSFLAKLATELKKPDGLIQITPENIDGHLATLKLVDLPGIASRNARRLTMIGIRTPLEMRHSSPALLRKAFGGVVGNYWYSRLNFGDADVDMIYNDTRTMSATRTISGKQRASRQSLESMFISLCTRLEQRLVKQQVFCRQVSFFIRYLDGTGWDAISKMADPVQDAMELRSHIQERIREYELARGIETVFSDKVQSMGVGIQSFINEQAVQYSLFDNRMKKDILRKAMYNIKDAYGKNIVRKGSELFEPLVMKDAIGFGSVRDMVGEDGSVRNKYLLEEDEQ